MVEWRGLTIVVKHTLSLKEVLEFVDNVAKTCFASDTGAFIPEVKDFAIKSNILEKYTNISLPSNLEHRYETLYYTDIINIILETINQQQFNEIMLSIDLKVENMAQANIENINKRMSDLNDSFESFQKQIQNMFDGIDVNNATNLVKNIINGNFDEAKLVDAYMTHTKKDDA